MMVLYNPMLKDFSVDVDKYGPNHKVLTIKAGDVKKFKGWEGKHIMKHLVTRLLTQNPPPNRNYEAKRKELEELVTVT